MTIDRLLEALRARPFRPFRLHLADGRAFDVVHPEYLARSPSGRTITIVTPDDHMHMVDMLLVTSIEVGPAEAA